jgi:chromosome segregation ATPase
MRAIACWFASLSVAGWLNLGGGGLELVGAALVIAGIRGERARARRHQKRGQVVELSGAIEGFGTVGTPTLSGGTPATFEQRVESLERRFGELREQLEEKMRAQTEKVREAAEQQAKAVERAFRREVDALIEYLNVKGSRRLETIGAVCIVAGIVVTTVGNVI